MSIVEIPLGYVLHPEDSKRLMALQEPLFKKASLFEEQRSTYVLLGFLNPSAEARKNFNLLIQQEKSILDDLLSIKEELNSIQDKFVLQHNFVSLADILNL